MSDIDTRLNFTEGAVAKLAHVPVHPKSGKVLPKVPKAYTIYWDTRTSGLGVRVTVAGARSYIHQARVRGRTVRTTIGKAGSKAWPLDKARVDARRLTVDCDSGVDPRFVVKAKRAQDDAERTEAQRHGHVVEGVWQAYIEANKAGWGERQLADHVSLAHPGGGKKKRGKGLTKPAPLAALMPLKLSELDSGRIASWLGREAKKRPTSAAGAYRLLRAFCNWTQDKPEKDQPDYHGIIPLDACTAAEVVKVLPESNAKEDDCLQRGQLAAWFQAVRGLRNPVIAAFLQSLLLTGPRRE